MWGQVNDGRRIQGVLRPAGVDQPAEHFAVGCACVGSLEIRDEGAGVTEQDVRGHVVCLWIIAGILLFVGSLHNRAFVNLTERIEALEQSETSKAQQ